MLNHGFLCFAILHFLGFPTVQSSPHSPAASDIVKGEKLFRIHCAVCHGPKGEGGKGANLAVPKLLHAATEEALKRVIQHGISGTEMPESDLEEPEIEQIVAYVHQLGYQLAEPVSGDPQAGRQLYFTKGGCDSCHMIRGRGSAFGPDLTNVGLRRGASYLRKVLVDPTADIPKGFMAYRTDVSIPETFLMVEVHTKTGHSIQGIRINEDTFSIQIRDASDRIYSFFKSELVELKKEWGKSPMPSYGEFFSKEELNDVTAFLVSLRDDQ
jgi:putative heme-binding domain-containing protein